MGDADQPCAIYSNHTEFDKFPKPTDSPMICPQRI